jgi:hypothetical protein
MFEACTNEWPVGGVFPTAHSFAVRKAVAPEQQCNVLPGFSIEFGA